MEIEKALLVVSKEAPCGHHCVDTSLGNGRFWAKCEDCGELVQQEYLQTAKEAEALFEEAIETIRAALSR